MRTLRWTHADPSFVRHEVYKILMLLLKKKKTKLVDIKLLEPLPSTLGEGSNK